LSDNEVTISASIVVHNPNIQILNKVILSLKNSFFRLSQAMPAKLNLYIVDNSSNINKEEDLMGAIHRNAQYLDNFQISLINSSTNVGYGGGNNLAIERSKDKYFLVLNPDVFLDESVLMESIPFMEANEKYGLLSPSVFGENGERHYLCKKNPTLFVLFLRSFAPQILKKIFSDRLSSYEMRERDYSQPMENISYLTGCFMLFRKAVLDKINGFDERYFMYLEDADISREVLKVSRTIYFPSAKITHLWERGSHKKWKLRFISIISSLKYSLKWFCKGKT